MIRLVEVHSAPADIDLRPEDEEECALGLLTGAEALAQSIANSTVALALEVDSIPAVFFGYAQTSVLGNVAWAWMLTTPLADSIPLAVAKASRMVVDHWLNLYPTLIIRVDPTYTRAVKWLDWLGFRPDSVVGPFLQMRADRKGLV